MRCGKPYSVLFVLGLSTLGAALLGGCQDPGPSSPRDEAPVACFTVEVEPDYRPQYLHLVFDASCSSDDLTSSDSLTVRWDFESDGTWDTPYYATNFRVREYSPPCDPRFSTARCEVRDNVGQTSQVTRSIDLGPRPVAPDLVLDRLSIKLGLVGLDIDSVRVGEEFMMWMDLTHCGDFGDILLTVRFLRDDIVFNEMQGSPPVGGDCWGWGLGGIAIDSVGTYSLSVILDPENLVQETDETNNSATTALRVVL